MTTAFAPSAVTYAAGDELTQTATVINNEYETKWVRFHWRLSTDGRDCPATYASGKRTWEDDGPVGMRLRGRKLKKMLAAQPGAKPNEQTWDSNVSCLTPKQPGKTKINAVADVVVWVDCKEGSEPAGYSGTQFPRCSRGSFYIEC